MYPYVVADIGGTNARFALITGNQNQQFQIENIEILNGSDFDTFEEALQAYLDTLPAVNVKEVCAAIAGPVGGDTVKMTNLSWAFSCKNVAKQFGLSHFIAMNDFAAVAAAANQVSDQHTVSIKSGTRLEHSNKAVFGPGTGLGVAGVVNHDGTWAPLPSEGGHVNLAPANALECDIIKAAIATYKHVSAESFLSGPGLVNLYKALCAVKNTPENDYQAADITSKALDNSDTLCRETLDVFCSFLGSFAGNLALTYGAKGGVYLAGGILPRFTDFLINSQFIERFVSKGPMSHYVEDIPVSLITHPEVAFAGAAAWLEQHLSNA